jgi:hypothetical protein
MREIRRVIEEQINNPSEDFVRFFASKVYAGKVTQQVKEQFTKLVKKTLNQFINEKINDTLNAAIKASSTQQSQSPVEAVLTDNEANEIGKDTGIVTTEEELDGYYIVKTILRDTIDPKRVTIKDTINYCSVLLDDSNRKPIIRMYFNYLKKYIEIFDEQKQEKVPLDKIDDIYKYGDRIKAIAQYYDTQKPQEITGKSLVSFTFKDKKYETKYWRDMLLKVSSIMAELHKDRFDEILTISGSKRPYFSRNSADLRSPNLIEGTDVFVEVALRNADSILRLCKNVLSKFGYSESDLSIETQEDVF